MSASSFVPYARKFLVALVTALTQLALVLSDNQLTNVEVISVVIAFLGALGVYAVSNKDY